MSTLPQESPTRRSDLVVGYVLKMFPRFSETFILNEVLELHRRGVKLCIFSMKTPNEVIRQPRVAELAEHVRVIPSLHGRGGVLHAACHLTALFRTPGRYLRTLHFVCGRRSGPAWKKFLVAPYITEIARRESIEHFHAHFASGPARQAKLVAMLSGTPFSFTAHAKDLYWKGHNHGKNKKLKKRVRLASFVITISEYNRRFIEGLNFKVPRRRLVTVYNGLHLERWPFLRPTGRPPAEANRAPLILAVGRLVEKKGFSTLIEAAELLRRAGHEVQCVIAGEGPERTRLKLLIERHGLEEYVLLPGSIPQDKLLKEYYARAVALAVPSVVGQDGDQDGIPTVILEALAIGLPVVATNVSGIGEAVLAGKSGLLIPPGNPTLLARALQDLLTDDGLVARLAQGGRSLVERRFDLQNNAKILIHLMETSARGGVLWSQQKLRERAGLTPLQETVVGKIHEMATES